MPRLDTTLGTIFQDQKGTLTGRLRVRAVRLAGRKWYDAGGRAMESTVRCWLRHLLGWDRGTHDIVWEV